MKQRILGVLLLLLATAPAKAVDFNPQAWDGNWFGMWNNTTFDSWGPVYMHFTFDPVANTVAYRLDLAGFVFGLNDPPPSEGSGSYNASGASMPYSDTLTAGNLTLGADGSFTIASTTSKTPGIARFTVNGTNNNGNIELTYEVVFSGGGGSAEGEGRMIRRPIGPLNLGDLNNNKTDEIASLFRDAKGNTKVSVRDSKTRKRLRVIGFGKTERSVAMVVVPDTNGNGKPDIAHLGVNLSNGDVRVQLKDSRTGKTIRNLMFDNQYAPIDLVFVPGRGLGVLGMSEAGMAQVEILSENTGSPVMTIDLGSNIDPFDAEVVATGTPGVAVLGVIKDSIDGLVSNSLMGFNYSSADGSEVNRVSFITDLAPVALLVEGTRHLSAMAAVVGDGSVALYRRVLATGANAKTINFGTTHVPKQVMRVGNVGGKKPQDVAFLGINKTTGAVQAKLYDTGTAKSFRVINYNKNFKPGGMTKVRNFAGGKAAELAVQGKKANNASRLEVRDLKTKALLKTIPVP